MTPEKYDSLSPYEKADIIEEYKIYTNSWSDIEDYDEVQDTIDSGYASFYQLNGDLQTAIQSGDYDYLIIGESYASEYNVGDYVRMTDDAIDNYGEQYRDKEFRISYVSKSIDDHMGYDEGVGGNLYDLDGLNFSLYDYELE